MQHTQQQTLLVTGGAGFIGANFLPYFLENFPQYHLVNLDKLTYAGNLDNLQECNANPRYTFVQGDICDSALVNQLFEEYDIRGVFHFAAESHVDNSITGPLPFIKTNIEGTFTLLEAARKHWMSAPGKPKPGYANCRFHHISTDEVYGSLGETGLFTEQTAYAPNSPYSASKASSDFLVRAYYHTYGLNVTTSNCSNNYGPKQHAEKLIPTIMRKALAWEPIPIYGDGKNVRDWLYVLDHCKAIALVWQKGRAGETYNIGGHNERNNLQIVERICSILDELRPAPHAKHYKELVTFVKDRAGHDRRYAIDATKITQELGWKADENFETGIRKTVAWYLDYFSRNQSALSGGKSPKISIIVPVYNSEKTLERCLRSILNQTYTNTEIIVVFRPRTDGTQHVLDKFKDSVRVIVQQDNTGPGGARNLGLNAASGEYVGFVEADDEIAPDFYEKLLSALQTHKADVAWGQMWVNGRPEDMPQNGAYPAFPEGYALLKNGASFDKLFKKSILQKSGACFMTNCRWEDNPFLLQVFLHAGKMAVCREACYYYNPSPWSSVYRQKLRQDLLPVVQQMMSLAKQAHLPLKQLRLVQKHIILSFADCFLLDPGIYAQLAEQFNKPFFLKYTYFKKRFKRFRHSIFYREQKHD